MAESEYDFHLSIIIPIGIPAIGKSRFSDLLREGSSVYGYELAVISSDEIKAELMSRIMESSGVEHDEAFRRCGKEALGVFSDRIRAEMTKYHERAVIYLDKQHPPSVLTETLEIIRSVELFNTRLRLFALVPDTKPVQIGEAKFPFSVQMLGQCLARVVSRETHETLVGSVEKRVGVVYLMYKMFEGVEEVSGWVQEQGLEPLEFPFTNETVEYPADALAVLGRFAADMRGRFVPNEVAVKPLLPYIAAISDVMTPPANPGVAILSNLM